MRRDLPLFSAGGFSPISVDNLCQRTMHFPTNESLLKKSFIRRKMTFNSLL